jgi:predicted transcriptional regulator
VSHQDKRLYAHTIEFKARAIDRARIHQVLERTFGARQISVRSVPTKREEKSATLRPDWQPRHGSIGSKILALLSDGSVHRRAEILRRIPDRSAIAAITRLSDVGAIISPAWGYYAKAGVDISNFEKPAFNPNRFGPALRRMLDELEQPRSAVELKEIVGGTRQAIEQKLKKLRQMKLIKRVDALGEKGRHIYIKADDRADQILLARPPALKDQVARLLSSVPPEATVKLSDIICTGNGAVTQRKHITSLVRRGLLEWSGTVNKRIVRLTNLGREHPQYEPSAPKAAPLRESIIPTESLQILLGIHALGEARSIDLTLALHLPRGKKSGARTGQYIQQLEIVGFIEPVHTKEGRHHPVYRLTPTGISHVATIRGEVDFPDPDELRAALAQARDAYAEEQRRRAPRGFPNRRSRLGDIVAVLRAHGPLETTAINGYLPEPYTDPRSINLAMNTLLGRGQVVTLREHAAGSPLPILWGLPTGST